MFLLFFVLFFLILAACSNEGAESSENETEEKTAETETAEEAEQILRIANDQEPAGLDPHKIPAASSIRVYSKVYEGLVTFNENMEIIGQLAESWEQPDDVTYIFNW